MKKLSSVVFVLLAIVLLAGCDKDSNPIDTTPTKKPTAPTVSFDGPTTNSTNEYAQQAQAFSQMFNGFASFFTAFSGLEGTQNGNTWTYTFSGGPWTETITVTQLPDNSYTWSIVINGVYEDVTVNNWKAFEGTSSADGKSGTWKIYAENSTLLEVELSWAADAQGNETGSMKFYQNGVLDEQLDIVNNVNGTGSMKLWDKKTSGTGLYLNIEITWLANGTGAYTVYNESGVITAQGTF